MNHLDIVVPTRNRSAKLLRMLRSIPIDARFSIVLVCDGETITQQVLQNLLPNRPFMRIIRTAKQQGSAYCRNLAIKDCEDGVLYATDDIVFDPGSIAYIMESFNKRYPDNDGVVGFTQRKSKFHPTGVALVGKKFVQRYPFKQLFFPGYFHFCCQEVHELAVKLDRFYLDPKATLFHYYPSSHEADQTHFEARKYKAEDFKLRRRRKKLGIIWGDKNGTNKNGMV